MSLPPEYGHTLEGAATTLVGQRVGNFVVERLIGEGAMGTVYVGLHETLNRRVAIKVLKPELAANEVLVNRFVDEARAASQLGHPGLVQIFDFGVLPDRRLYSVMEFLHGTDLEAAITRDGAQAVGRVAAIGAEVASALAAAHAKGIVHRDLKPANLFLSRDEDGSERVKVLDFGIAKLLAGHESARTQAGHIVGTPEYMAPEQAQARTNIDHRVDVYSLGCVLYELLIGQPPHTGDNIPSILVAQLQDAPVPPTQLRRDIPQALEHIILRCLAKRPEDRFQSMEEVRGALLPYEDSTIAPQTQRKSRVLPPPTQPTMEGVRGGRRWLLMLSALLALGAAVVVFFVVQGAGKSESSAGATADTIDASATTTALAADEGNPFKTTDQARVGAGKAIYVSDCLSCHGELGAGNGPDFDPKNPPKPLTARTDIGNPDRYYFDIIQRGVEAKGMPGFGAKLTPEETWEVVTYVRVLSAPREEVADEGLYADQPPTTKKLIRRGGTVFATECVSCHGNDGKGKGPEAENLARLPADLTLGSYKVRSTPKSSIPTDQDIYRTISKGVGTGVMPGFTRIHPYDRWALVAYLKTLSKRFAKEEPGRVAEVPPRPRVTAESIARGRSVFQMSGCPKCHGSEGRGKDPEVTGLTDPRGNKLEAPDFADRYDFLGGTKPEEVWLTMWNGLSGVKMPMGQTVMNETDAWDVVNWIMSLQGR